MGKEEGLDLLTRKSKKRDHRIWNIGYGPYDIVSGLHITDMYIRNKISNIFYSSLGKNQNFYQTAQKNDGLEKK